LILTHKKIFITEIKMKLQSLRFFRHLIFNRDTLKIKATRFISSCKRRQTILIEEKTIECRATLSTGKREEKKRRE